MTTELDQFYAKLQRSSAAAFQATPPLFAFLDKLFYSADSYQNTAGIATRQAIDETYAFKIADIFEPRQTALQNKIQGILMQDAFVTDQSAQVYAQQAKKAEIKNLLEAEKQKRENLAENIAQYKAFRALEEAKSEQLQRMMASEFSSSQGTTEDKAQSMQDIELARLLGPKDIATA